mmetsp:Transcript_39347/g.37781  ORF Transcript_39347/g.37781 Transcript_39347/m.37781 type:complete len:198 (+) Transcript_39347:1240-1833(+)
MSNIAIFAYLLRDQDVSFSYTGKEDKLNFHLSDHYAYCRDKFIKNHFYHYWLWYAYGWLAPVALIILPLYAYRDGIMENGKTDGNYTCGFVAFFCLIIIHHMQVALLIRNWTWLMFGFFFFSILLLPWFIWRTDIGEGNFLSRDYYHTIFKEPIFWFSSIIAIAWIMIPFYAAKCVYFVILRTEEVAGRSCYKAETI